MPCSQMISMNCRPPRESAPEESGDVAGREGPDLEQVQPEHRVGDPGLDPAERRPAGRRRRHHAEHERVRPAHGMPAVRLYPVDHAGQQGGQADREGDVAEPVDAGRDADAVVDQLQVGPRRAEHPERHRDQEHQAPVDGRQQPAQHQSDKRAGDGGHAVDPESQARADPPGRRRSGWRSSWRTRATHRWPGRLA